MPWDDAGRDFLFGIRSGAGWWDGFALGYLILNGPYESKGEIYELKGIIDNHEEDSRKLLGETGRLGARPGVFVAQDLQRPLPLSFFKPSRGISSESEAIVKQTDLIHFTAPGWSFSGSNVG